MPDYFKRTLERLQHKAEVYPQYSPHPFTAINYSKQPEAQYAMKDDNSPLMLPKEVTYVQRVVGSFLYYARAIDSTMLTALSQIAHQQSQPTDNTMKKCQQLMDYTNTYCDTAVRFYASDMVLEVDSDAAYLVMPKAQSIYAGYSRLLQNKETQHRRIHN